MEAVPDLSVSTAANMSCAASSLCPAGSRVVSAHLGGHNTTKLGLVPLQHLQAPAHRILLPQRMPPWLLVQDNDAIRVNLIAVLQPCHGAALPDSTRSGSPTASPHSSLSRAPGAWLLLIRHSRLAAVP